MSAPAAPGGGRSHTVHGAPIGILMLNTGFERLPGDVGHAGTWSFPVLYKVVETATQDRLFGDGATSLADAFVEGANELVRLGAIGITTSCGFLAAIQPELSARCPVPVATSSLMQIPMVQRLLPAGKRVGVLTADAAALTPAHFVGVGAPTDCPVIGLDPDGVFRTGLRTNAPRVDPAAQEAEMLRMGETLLAANPDLGALVCECTNMAPHSAALARHVGLPVFDIVTLVEWFHSALVPRSFAGIQPFRR